MPSQSYGSIERAKLIFEDQIKGMILSLSCVKDSLPLHPILDFLGMA